MGQPARCVLRCRLLRARDARHERLRQLALGCERPDRAVSKVHQHQARAGTGRRRFVVGARPVEDREQRTGVLVFNGRVHGLSRALCGDHGCRRK